MTFEIPSDNLIVLDRCNSCNRWGLRSKQMKDCLCCSFPSRTQRRSNGICNHPGCNEEIIQRFVVEVGVELKDRDSGQIVNDVSEGIVAQTVNTIIQSIIMIHGPQCELHLSSKFHNHTEPIPDAPTGRSAFDYLLNQLDQDNMKKINEDFQEEWQ